MNLGKVIGVVVATIKDASLKGAKLYVIEPCYAEDCHPEDAKHPKDLIAESLIAADTVGSNLGDLVIWVASREAALAMPQTFTPVDAAVIGIVDQVCDRRVNL